ncbi:MAG: dimethylsulfoniopropionate demethylase [Granulosicoccus sp.]
MNSPLISMSRRLRKTPFTSRVMRYGVKAFTVYNRMLLPTEFDSLQEDYWHLCCDVQVWDVGAERQVSIKGPDADRLVQWMTPRNISKVALDQCAYLPLADEHGKLVNDPVGIRLAEDHWWLSVADSDVILWAKGLARGAGLRVAVTEPDVWPLAVQGPKAEDLVARVFGEEIRQIRFFRYRRMAYRTSQFIVARSGWSKQGGFEIYVNDVNAGQQLYDELFAMGEDLNVRPGSPNLIERMESGLLSFGNDMDSRHSVLEAGLGSFVSLDDDIPSLSHAALRAERERPAQRRLLGLMIDAEDGPMPVSEQPFTAQSVDEEHPYGSLQEALFLSEQTGHSLGSQVYSPRFRKQLATVMIEEPLLSEVEHHGQCEVVLEDGQRVTARVCTLPFDFTWMESSMVV